MNYFEWAENHKRKAPVTTHDTVEIPGILVTEGEAAAFKFAPCYTGQNITNHHEWTCSCVKCRIDRCEDTL